MAHGCTCGDGEGLVFGWKATQCDLSFALLPRRSFQLASSGWVGSPLIGSCFHSSRGWRPKEEREGGREGQHLEKSSELWRGQCSGAQDKLVKLHVAFRFKKQHTSILLIVGSSPKVYFYPVQADCSQASTVRRHLVKWPCCEPRIEHNSATTARHKQNPANKSFSQAFTLSSQRTKVVNVLWNKRPGDEMLVRQRSRMYFKPLCPKCSPVKA